MPDKTYLGINLLMDPSVAVVRDGRVIAYSEEERHIRNKHAPGVYPRRALEYCLATAGVGMEEIAAVGINWDLDAYTDGRMRAFYESLRRDHPVDAATIRWQERNLARRDRAVYAREHHREWRAMFGDRRWPDIRSFGHHFVHAFHAYMQSGFDEAVCLTVDGSGDQHCTVVWHCRGDELRPIRELTMPHSLGWVYAAFTEYLGFEAYDGEYKVMGLAAYGEPDEQLRRALAQIVTVAPDGVGYRVDGRYLHYGPHSVSDRFTDDLVGLLGEPPRRRSEPTTKRHENIAFAVQECLEVTVARLATWALRETGARKLCIGGGVGLNVKMNSALFQMPGVDDLFAHPLCSDAGASAGVALAACHAETGARPERLTSLALGLEASDDEIEQTLRMALLDYERPTDLPDTVAAELEAGRIVAWFQGRMEAGPRALGQRSILADPRVVENRDRVNAIIKFREYWRPFCPSILAEDMPSYFERFTEAPFMILAFPASARLAQDAPAIVHIDGTSRVQMVRREHNPRYYDMIAAFKRRTGVGAVLNTSFNVKGEPIVCTVQDALRTFWSTGLDALAIGSFLVRKPGSRPRAA